MTEPGSADDIRRPLKWLSGSGLAKRLLQLCAKKGKRNEEDVATRPRSDERSARTALPRPKLFLDLGQEFIPVDVADYSTLPGSAFQLVIEIVSENSANGEYTEKARWYAERGIPEYWIVDRTPERSHDDALVHLHRLTLSGSAPAYVRERTLRLSELEAEYKAKSENRP